MNVVPAIQREFDPEIVLQLIQFGNSLSELDADILVFMARKSLCLYDLLLKFGITPVQACVVSDRVLDMRLDPFRGKKVALIDDTLILGTTLAKTKLLLESGGATVTTHVFCLDKKWWCKDLIKPDAVSLALEDDQVMAFCSAEVRALSILPRPYIVDFPLSRLLKLSPAELPAFLSDLNWRTYNISTALQERNQVASLTFFPTDAVLKEFNASWDNTYSDCLEIVKVRAFARKQRDVYWLQLVPIVVLKPIGVRNLRRAFDRTLADASLAVGHDLDRLTSLTESPESQQRLLQHALSCSLGRQYAASMGKSLSRQLNFVPDAIETDRHFGPWVHDELDALSRYVPDHSNSTKRIHILPSEAPASVLDWSAEVLRKNTPFLFTTDDDGSEIDNLVADFTEVFLNNYDLREIPTREEAKKLGRRILDQSRGPSRDRLEMGIPWSSIVDHFALLAKAKPSRELRDILTLVLDYCNDQGVTVPITCVQDNVVFRAYRHGEDVKFTDAEVALTCEAIDGFFKGSHRTSITKLKLEKLLVILIKIGIARQLMEPLFVNTSGVQSVLRIGFNLRGAIPLLRRGPQNRADTDEWFTQYLRRRGVIAPGANKKNYVLRKRVTGNFRSVHAPEEAWELGYMIGLLTQSSKNSSAPLDDTGLTLLATCATPRHAAAALQAELDIFLRYWDDYSSEIALGAGDWDDVGRVLKVLKDYLIGNGHMAVNSALMKFVGYRNGAPEAIVGECSKYLRDHYSEVDVRRWNSYWRSLKSLEAVEERIRFDPLIEKAAVLCWELAACLFMAELSLRQHLRRVLGSDNPYADTSQCVEKMGRFRKNMKKQGVAESPFLREVFTRFARQGEDQSADLGYRDGYSQAIEWLRSRLPLVEQRVEVMAPAIEQFGRLFDRHDYQLMVYYDLVDSTATRAGRRGVDVEEYRAEVEGCKGFINNQLARLCQGAIRDGTEVFLWNGTGSSTNDCKHIFIGGPGAWRILHECIADLASAMEAYPRCAMRIHVVPCNFMGTGVYRHECETEPSGKKFWEHWSRITKAAKPLEDGLPDGKSFLMLVGEPLIDKLVLPEQIHWPSPAETTLSSEIGLVGRSVKIKYGEISTS